MEAGKDVPKTNGHFHFVSMLSLGPAGEPSWGWDEGGAGSLPPITGTINFFLFPAEEPAQGERPHCAAAPRIDRLRFLAGSVSCLVTPQRSNYHRGMHNGLINN